MNVLDGDERESAFLWRVPDPGGPELLRAAFRTRTFARHAHERFAIGVIESGGLAFRYRGQAVMAPAGWVNLAFPGEAHSGQAAGDEGWRYRMFYLDPAHLLEILRGIDPGLRELPFVAAGAVWDPGLARRVAALHRLCADPAADPLERQTRLGALAAEAFHRHGGAFSGQPVPKGSREVQLAKRFIEDASTGPIQLVDLAALTGMNPYTLVRCFTRALGMPPHAYQVQVRVDRAAALLRSGVPPAAAAAEAGFADQSHLNRHFLRHVGVTPGAYRKAFQR